MGRYLDIADAVLTHRWAKKAAALLATIADSERRLRLRESFEERAGICEFDGGLSRDAAECLAYEELAQRMKDEQ